MIDFLAVGDIVTEPFIKLKDATVHCNIDNENCTISMRWGDKIPYESAVLCRAVGNSPNAATSAARIGLATALVSDIGDDDIGKGNLEQLASEGIDTTHITTHKGMVSNYHYVLSYESERTILVKHEEYPYRWPRIEPPRFMYISSMASNSLPYHREIETYLEEHPDVFVTLQPGTFQMKLGVAQLQSLYRRTNLIVINKEESERILGIPESEHHEMKELLTKVKGLGPRAVIITDGRNGAYAFDGSAMYSIPMYPDDRAPVERTGAGDAFASTVTAALALGKPFAEALLWGPINSMSVVQEIGAQKGLLSRSAIEKYLEDAPPEYKVSSL